MNVAPAKLTAVEVDELIVVRVRRTADAESGHPARIGVAQPVQDQPAAPVGQERDVFAARRRDKDGAVADLGNAARDHGAAGDQDHTVGATREQGAGLRCQHRHRAAGQGLDNRSEPIVPPLSFSVALLVTSSKLAAAIVQPLSRSVVPFCVSITAPAPEVCSLPPRIVALLKSTCAPLPEAKIVPVPVLLMLAPSRGACRRSPLPRACRH